MTDYPQSLADIRSVLADLLAGRTLDESAAEEVFELILAGRINDAPLGAMLALMAVRLPTVQEIVAGVRVMRRHVTRVPLDGLASGTQGSTQGSAPVVIDTCGTGGAPKAFNVSTAAAIVAAAAGKGKLLVAKHGGRSRTGRGSAEVLERLGVNVNASPGTQARCLREIGICFSFAQQHHPAMRHAAAARKSLGFPTVFNLVGPLSNPAGADRQLVGTYSREIAARLAQALAAIGACRAMVVTSADGMDELTTTAPNYLYEIGRGEGREGGGAEEEHCSGEQRCRGGSGGVVRETVLDTRDLAFPRRTLAELSVGSLEDAAHLFAAVLDERAEAPSPRDGASVDPDRVAAARELVVLNAGAALEVGGVVGGLREGIERASEAIGTGAARQTLESLIRLTGEDENAEGGGASAGSTEQGRANPSIERSR